MRKLFLFLLGVGLFLPAALLRADDLVTITSDDIQLNEPAFSNFIQQKSPQLLDRLSNLAKETEVLHLNVDFNHFAGFWKAVQSYFNLRHDLEKNIQEYTAEAEQVRSRIFSEPELRSGAALKLIIDYKFLRKNIRYAKMSIDSLTRDFRMLFIVLRNKPIDADIGEVKDLAGYAAAMVGNIHKLRNKEIKLKEFIRIADELYRPVNYIENADLLHQLFLQVTVEAEKGRFWTGVKRFRIGLGRTLRNFSEVELYVVENKKITLGRLICLLFFVAFCVLGYRLARHHLIRAGRFQGGGLWHTCGVLFKYAVVIAIGLVTLFGLGLDLAKVTLLVSAVTVGIGFGLQKIFSNLISGIILLFDKSIKLGDTLQIDDFFGTVTSMNARFVSVMGRDGREHLIPNEKLIVDNVVNLTYSSRHFRLDIPVGIAYKSDVPQAMRLMEEAALTVPRVLARPAPEACLIAFGSSSIDLEIRAWIIDPEQGLVNVKSDILVAIWESFHRHGIEIPFSQQDIYIKEVPEHLRLS
ncbi:MAG: mechanosensitive ion channel [Deltaproteobacteria bacterium]|nr:mechanosensitive ion channel [Deltaproteobacteria bacterium]